MQHHLSMSCPYHVIYNMTGASIPSVRSSVIAANPSIAKPFVASQTLDNRRWGMNTAVCTGMFRKLWNSGKVTMIDKRITCVVWIPGQISKNAKVLKLNGALVFFSEMPRLPVLPFVEVQVIDSRIEVGQANTSTGRRRPIRLLLAFFVQIDCRVASRVD